MLKKYILAAILIAALTIGGYGCMDETKGEYRPFAGALDYMEQKYGEKFTYIETHGAFMFADSKKITVSCESFPGEAIYVSVQRKNGKETYADSYMAHYFAGQVEEFVIDIAKDYFDVISFKESMPSGGLAFEMDLTTTFEEYFYREEYFIDGVMEIGESDEETMRKFAEEFVSRNIHFSFDINIPSINERYCIDYFRDYTEYDFYRRR
ncbi:MAG: hypothetical protein FWH48_08510 [Oscillospiraceae bacterium]|nr:hypothetical protein [Oscillospiraceae bacterium]